MRQTNIIRLIPLLILVLLPVIGCTPVAETQADFRGVPPVEEQPAPTPEPPKKFPAPKGFVNDFGDVLDPASNRELESKLAALRQDHKVDFAVVTVLSTGPETIEDYSLAMTREWKVGSENGGLLLMVSVDDRNWRIQIDRKLEKLMSNDEVGRIGELMVPAFKRKEYGAGVRKCVDAMITTLKKKLANKSITP